MEGPLVSVIIPTWNRCDLLAEALASVLGQTACNGMPERVEILVVDDGSEDETTEVIRSFENPSIRHFSLPHTGRISKLRNAGMERARGDYVAFLDSDDLWSPEKLEVQVAEMEANPNAGFTFTGFRTFDGAGNVRTELYRSDDRHLQSVQNIFEKLIAGGMGPYPSSVLIKKEALAKTGLLDESFAGGDYEFLSRLAFAFPAIVVHSPLVSIRKHPGNRSAVFSAEDLREAILTVEWAYRARRISRSIFADRILHYRAELARMFLKHGDEAEARKQINDCLATLEIGEYA
jgi:glycosyltransferase involved in cell wall biosynthesis